MTTVHRSSNNHKILRDVSRRLQVDGRKEGENKRKTITKNKK